MWALNTGLGCLRPLCSPVLTPQQTLVLAGPADPEPAQPQQLGLRGHRCLQGPGTQTPSETLVCKLEFSMASLCVKMHLIQVLD